MPLLTAPRRLLASPVVDLLLGPHGVDRYLELIRPSLTVRDPRAEVVEVSHQTERSVTLRLRPNLAWTGFRAGQFIRLGVEIDGVRHTRTYSPACAQPARGSGSARRELELTVTVHPEGLVSRHLKTRIRPGDVVYLGEAQGEFVLPDPRPETLVLISGGSGITPVLSMLRTLGAEGHDGDVVFLHYARTAEDWLYRDEVARLAERLPGLRVDYVATRAGGEHISPGAITALLPNPGVLATAHVAVCGPPPLIDAVSEIWSAYPGGRDRVLSETFTPPRLLITDEPGTGTLHFTQSNRTAAVSSGSLLEQAEAAGLTPAFGCRMGICHTCTCRKSAGAVRNLLTGEVSDGEDEDIQLCISVPAGDVALEL
jgi:stearoyl-CoA 9-desaturase NADPH oxidoreductase